MIHRICCSDDSLKLLTTDPHSYIEVCKTARAIDFQIPIEDTCDDLFVASKYDSDEELRDLSMIGWHVDTKQHPVPIYIPVSLQKLTTQV
jgi:hypothetical protein